MSPTEQVGQFHGQSSAGTYTASSGLIVEALLDNIRSSHNVGSIFRTADTAGVRALHLAGITAAGDHPRVAKTALGAQEAVPWNHGRNGLDMAIRLQEAGFRLWGIEAGIEASPLFEQRPRAVEAPILLIVGNERAGIDPGIRLHCERLLSIPMQGVKRSLNVAVAFGIAAYYVRFAYHLGFKRTAVELKVD